MICIVDLYIKKYIVFEYVIWIVLLNSDNVCYSKRRNGWHHALRWCQILFGVWVSSLGCFQIGLVNWISAHGCFQIRCGITGCALLVVFKYGMVYGWALMDVFKYDGVWFAPVHCFQIRFYTLLENLSLHKILMKVNKTLSFSSEIPGKIAKNPISGRAKKVRFVQLFAAVCRFWATTIVS